MSDMESKDDDANLLSPLLLKVHQDVQSFTTLFKDTFTAPLSTEYTSKLLNTAFKLISSQDGDTSKINMVYLLFCLHAHGGVDVLKIPLKALRMLPKDPYLKSLFSCGIISITTEPSMTTSTIRHIPEHHQNSLDKSAESTDEDKPKSYNTRTIALKRQFKTLIEDIQSNDVLRNQLFNNSAQSNALHVLNTNYERWRSKAATLIKDSEIRKHFSPSKSRYTYEQRMNSLKNAYEALLENYYLPVYPPKRTLAKYKHGSNKDKQNNTPEHHSTKYNLRIRSTNTTPPPHLLANDLDLQGLPNEVLGHEQERPNTAPPDISCMHDDMPTFSE